MKEITPLEWDTVEKCLAEAPGVDKKTLKANFEKYLTEGEGKKGVHFFLIEFAPREIIMPKGVYSDYAGVLLEGDVEVLGGAPGRLASLPVADCWRRPGRWRRALERWASDRVDQPTGAAPPRRTVLRRMGQAVARGLHWLVAGRGKGEIKLSKPYEAGVAPEERRVLDVIREGASFDRRIMGVISVVWNLPRSATLAAAEDRPCRVLLIKRYALNDLIKRAPNFYEKKVLEFTQTILKRQLADNQLLRHSLYIEDVREDKWPSLVSRLKGETRGGLPDVEKRIRDLLDAGCKAMLKDARPDEFGPPAALPENKGRPEADPKRKEKYQIVKALKEVLRGGAPGRDGGGGEEPDAPEDAARRSWRLFHEAFADVLYQEGDFFPLTGSPYAPLTEAALGAFLADLERAFKTGDPLMPTACEEGDVIFKRGDPADALYIILSGKFQVTRGQAEDDLLVNHLEAGGYFGESCIEEGATRTSGVKALTRGVLLKLPGELVRKLAAAHPAVRQKLRCERQRMAHRDWLMESGRRSPHREVPQHLAAKLLRGTNLLLIDMDKCTRCDQCVRSCGQAHDDVPRFHRANPSLRFGKWEVAAACLHCVDAPCQHVCPVGAITFLDTRAVQIHRDRCIGCTQCAKACPYQVIDMYAPVHPGEAPSLARPKYPNVATKCDLCLTKDHDPPCVGGCPYGAARRGAPEVLFPSLKGFADFVQAGE